MTQRIDSASRSIAASPDSIYAAFATSDALARWLPPSGMTGEMLRFDFREGGSYRMRLTYAAPPQGGGKTSADTDEVEVRLTRLEPGRAIEQEIVFESDDPAFAGVMSMAWAMERDGDRTIVSVRAEHVPEGIRPEDHVTAMHASLEHLARFVEEEG
jgi:uncharacterized protein YndB with AHSA1/START domain